MYRLKAEEVHLPIFINSSSLTPAIAKCVQAPILNECDVIPSVLIFWANRDFLIIAENW